MHLPSFMPYKHLPPVRLVLLQPASAQCASPLLLRPPSSTRPTPNPFFPPTHHHDAPPAEFPSFTPLSSAIPLFPGFPPSRVSSIKTHPPYLLPTLAPAPPPSSPPLPFPPLARPPSWHRKWARPGSVAT